MKLFAVRMKSFISYYAIADSYDDAVRKIEEYLNKRENAPIISRDGSIINLPEDPIKQVELLTEEVII